ncbi:sec-independent protein translocase protein TatB [Rhizobium sp. RU35A]|uniref:Sec-independent protein translocase protein TatB n=1 Tax=Rhizobium sp. RU35A TaxID=1907414 RepID=UPI0009541DC1|nr:Sec-independent protein translocase protein TatB [Rhizobium sp. RU35A]SIQ81499.1 sec-independent protein translocase protein TatB [Rhizobium sp. RU35A]
MLDIGWTELLVIAVVLIVVVGPKDLPPMLRAFGKMTANLRKMAGDFRTQFDQALREADMDDLRQTISDAQRFHPANALREAINPLREMGNEIRNDLQKATTLPSAEATDGQAAGENAAGIESLLPTSGLSLPETPPAVAPVHAAAPPAPAQPAAAQASTPTASVASVSSGAASAPSSITAAAAAPAAPAASSSPAQSEPISAAPVKKPRAPRKPKVEVAVVAEPVPAVKSAVRRARTAKPAVTETASTAPVAETAHAAKPAPRPRKKPATPKDNA